MVDQDPRVPRHVSLAFTVLSVLLGLAAPAGAQQAPTCDAAEHRQFDFWVGEWEVFNPDGEKVGENTITTIQNECVLHESWRGAGGGTGESFNIYSRLHDAWHQTWVSGSGTLLLMDGGLNEDGAMVLSGENLSPRGAVLDRITWTPLDGQRVRQLWERSADGGETWSVVFNGLYVRKDR